MSGSQSLIVKLTKEGKSKEEIVMQVVARTFLGPAPPGCVPYHINGCQTDNYVNNISYITRRELGKKTGAKIKAELWYILIEVDGKVMLELDKFNSVYNVLGKDMLEEVNKYC